MPLEYNLILSFINPVFPKHKSIQTQEGNKMNNSILVMHFFDEESKSSSEKEDESDSDTLYHQLSLSFQPLCSYQM
jgi:hypothetical protein